MSLSEDSLDSNRVNWQLNHVATRTSEIYQYVLSPCNSQASGYCGITCSVTRALTCPTTRRLVTPLRTMSAH
jgi:hypothetical protein